MRAGFVAVVGRTNVGKSTLVNGLVGEKVAIVTSKPQTTRNVIRGILNEARGQMVFLDTPGLHKPKTRMNQAMVHLALESLEGVDAVLWVINASESWRPEEEQLAERIKLLGCSLVVALNQVDKVKDKAQLLPLMAESVPALSRAPRSTPSAPWTQRIFLASSTCSSPSCPSTSPSSLPSFTRTSPSASSRRRW